MASTYLTRTPTSNGSSTTWTYSVWVKRSADLGAYQRILSNGNQEGSGSQDTGIYFLTDDTIRFDVYFGDVGNVGKLDTNRKFRDTNGWYHLVFVWNTSSSTSSDRMKIYVNGVRETSFASATYPSQNASDPNTNTTSYPMRIGTRATNQYFNGLLSHAHFIDGTAYDASAFGETDANGVWTINTSPSVTYGTNGFFILKDGNSVTDQSGNSNNFTVAGGTLTDTLDCPDNVFATLNALDNYYQADTLSNGNLTMVGGGVYAPRTATFGLTSGKWYWEIQVNNWESSDGSSIGISSQLATASNYEYYNQSGDNVGYGYFSNGSGYGNAGTIFTGYGTGSGTHIIGIALDLDNNKIAWSYDGTWQGSADPSNGTNMISITAPSSLATGTYFPAFSQKDNSRVFNVNFGNGYFGTTAVASAGTNASGIGIFEYDVPTGYTALSTKGLNL